MKFIESRFLSYSIVLHTLLLLFAAFGLPALLPKNPDPVPLVMSVELLPVSEVSNVKPSDQPIQKEQKAPAVKNTKPIEPTVKEPPKPVTPPTPTPPKPATETEKHFDPTEGAEKTPDEKKPQPPKPAEAKKEDAKPQPKPDDFAALLTKLHQEAKTEPAKAAKDPATTPENKTKSDAPYDASQPMSMSEKDSIRSQFIPCWRMPAGAKDPHSLAVRIKVTLQPDGTILTKEIARDLQGRYNGDPYFRAAADSALRAVERCSPLKNLPADKYNSWKDMEINFDPADML